MYVSNYSNSIYIKTVKIEGLQFFAMYFNIALWALKNFQKSHFLEQILFWNRWYICLTKFMLLRQKIVQITILTLIQDSLLKCKMKTLWILMPSFFCINRISMVRWVWTLYLIALFWMYFLYSRIKYFQINYD